MTRGLCGPYVQSVSSLQSACSGTVQASRSIANVRWLVPTEVDTGGEGRSESGRSVVSGESSRGGGGGDAAHLGDFFCLIILAFGPP